MNEWKRGVVLAKLCVFCVCVLAWLPGERQPQIRLFAQDHVFPEARGTRILWLGGFREEGKTIVAIESHDSLITIWNWREGTKEHSVAAGGSSSSCAISQDGRTVVLGSGGYRMGDDEPGGISSRGRIRVFDCDTRTFGPNLETQGMVTAVALARDGKTMACAVAGPFSVDPDGVFKSLGEEGETIVIWDLGTRKQIQTITRQEKGTIFSLAFSPDGKKLAGGGKVYPAAEGEPFTVQGALVVWTLESPEDVWTPDTFAMQLRDVRFSPDGEILAALSPEEIRLYDVDARVLLRTMQANVDFLNQLVFSPNDRTMVSAGYDLIHWDIDTGTRIQQIECPGHTVHSLAYSRSGEFLATGSSHGRVRVWKDPFEQEKEQTQEEDGSL